MVMSFTRYTSQVEKIKKKKKRHFVNVVQPRRLSDLNRKISIISLLKN